MKEVSGPSPWMMTRPMSTPRRGTRGDSKPCREREVVMPVSMEQSFFTNNSYVSINYHC